MRDAGGVQRAQHGPGAVDVVGTPAAEPAAVILLARAADMPVRCASTGSSARMPIWARNDTQRAVTSAVGGSSSAPWSANGMWFRWKWVFSGSNAPQPPSLALHADDPVARAGDCVGVRRVAVAMQQHADDGGVVDVGIMRIVVLERPAARGAVRAARTAQSPSTSSDLRCAQPGAGGRRPSGTAAPCRLRRWRGRRGRCPTPATGRAGNRRGPSSTTSSCAPTATRWRRRGWSGRIAQRVEHHHAVGHGGVDRAEAVLAVQPFGDEGDGARRWRAGATAPGKSGSTRCSTASSALKKRPQLER